MDIENVTFNLDYDGENFSIRLYDGGVPLRGCEWRPESDPEFVVIYVHGLGSFLTANHDFADIILDSGGAFLGCDHLGHGRSPGPRAACTIDEVVQETELVIHKARESFPDLPLFLCGSSMGALAILQLIFEKPSFAVQNLRGVVILSPWISNSRQRPITFLEAAAIWLGSRLFPHMPVTSGTPDYSSDVSQDYVEKVVGCPLYSPFVTPRCLNSALRSMTFVRKSAADWPSDLPVLFCQGGGDSKVDPVANFAWFREVADASSKGIVSIGEYEYGSHNLLKGPDRRMVLQDILDFIQRHKQ
jgi:acylglycerol lipase